MTPTPDGLCEDCEDALAFRTWDTDPFALGPMGSRYVAVCADCWRARDNYEPPDADGEDICRDYGAERRDAQEAARRLK